MHLRIYPIIYFLCTLYSGTTISAQQALSVTWAVVAALPEYGAQPGVAGAFAGRSHGAILIAGGSNFPGARPWEGGKKVYYDNVHVFIKNNTGEYLLKQATARLDVPLAYGASVNYGDGILCIGGENENGLRDKAFQLIWDSHKEVLKILPLPSLPRPFTNLAAAVVGNKLFVAGGETSDTAADQFLCLDLGRPQTGWTALPPLPYAVAHAQLVPQRFHGRQYLYLIGGRTKHPGALTDFHRGVYAYDPANYQWSKRADLPFALAAGMAIPYDHTTILYIGGDRGETYHAIEERLLAISSAANGEKKQALMEEKNRLQQHHPGFSKDVLFYNTDADRWAIGGPFPFDAPVTTRAVTLDNDIFLLSGEIRPGVRSPAIIRGVIHKE